MIKYWKLVINKRILIIKKAFLNLHLERLLIKKQPKN